MARVILGCFEAKPTRIIQCWPLLKLQLCRTCARLVDYLLPARMGALIRVIEKLKLIGHLETLESFNQRELLFGKDSSQV